MYDIYIYIYMYTYICVCLYIYVYIDVRVCIEGVPDLFDSWCCSVMLLQIIGVAV